MVLATQINILIFVRALPFFLKYKSLSSKKKKKKLAKIQHLRLSSWGVKARDFFLSLQFFTRVFSCGLVDIRIWAFYFRDFVGPIKFFKSWYSYYHFCYSHYHFLKSSENRQKCPSADFFHQFPFPFPHCSHHPFAFPCIIFVFYTQWKYCCILGWESLRNHTFIVDFFFFWKAPQKCNFVVIFNSKHNRIALSLCYFFVLKNNTMKVRSVCY